MRNSMMTAAAFLAAAGMSIGIADAADVSVVLAENGRAQAKIVLPDEPKPYERTAGEELGTYLKKVTGADFETVAEAALAADATGIFVGNTRLAREQGPSPAGDEAWVMRTLDAKRLVLTGGEPNGTLFAVWHFLEDVVGVRWWTPWEEDTPRRESLAVSNLDRAGQPAFVFRWLHNCTGFDHTTPPLNYIRNRWHYNAPAWWRGGQPNEWEKYGRISMSDRVLSGHGMSVLMGFPYFYSRLSETAKQEFKTDVFDKHPNWFAMADGQRQIDSNPCLSNPEVFDRMYAKLEERVKANEAAYGNSKLKPLWYDVSVLDGPATTTCQCPECAVLNAKYGSYSGTVIWFVNKLAAKITETYPDVKLTSYMNYGGTSTAPRNITAHKSVILNLCLIGWDVTKPFGSPQHNMREASQAWFDAIGDGQCIFYWYHLFNQMPYTHPEYIARSLRYFRSKRCIGGKMEDHLAVSESFDDPIHWVTAKLMEDPDQDADALLREFCTGYYGPDAGAHVKAVWDALLAALDASPGAKAGLCGPVDVPHLDLPFLSQVSATFDLAEAACADNAERLLRVRYARMPYDYAILTLWPTMIRQRMNGPYLEMPLDRSRAGQRAVETYEAVLEKRIKNGPLKVFPLTGEYEYATYASADYLRAVAFPEQLAQLARTGVRVFAEDFEQAEPGSRLPATWITWSWPANKPRYGIASGIGYRSQRSAMVQNATGRDNALFTNIPVRPGERYYVEMYAKQNGKGAPRLTVLWGAASGGWNFGAGRAGAEFSIPLADLEDGGGWWGWQRAAVVVTVPSGDVTAMRVLLNVDDQDEQSVAYMDNVAVYRLEKQGDTGMPPRN